MANSEYTAANLPPNSLFLTGLHGHEINAILAAAKPRRYPATSVITFQGDTADRLFLLWRGRARYFFETSNGSKLLLIWISPGQIIGPAAVASRPSSYLVSAETVQDSVLLSWDRSTLSTFARRWPRLSENALLIAADYISWYVAAHAALTSSSAQERFTRTLRWLAPSLGQNVRDGVVLEVSNEELASAANVSVYTASRILSKLKRSGAISKRRGSLVLHSAQLLNRRL